MGTDGRAANTRHLAAAALACASLAAFGSSSFTQATAPKAALAITAEARALQPGELVILHVSSAAPIERVSVRAFDRDIPAYRVDATTWRALLGLDLDVATGAHVVTIDAIPQGRASHTLRIVPKKFPTRTLTVDDAFVNPPASVSARIAAESKEQDRIWNAEPSPRAWSGPFVRPVAEAANSAFGSRSVFNGQAKNPHSGADFLSPAGTPVHAPNAGRVLIARDLYYSGNTVIIDHGLGLFSFLCHLSRIDVQPGAVVKPNDVIGLVGATGRVTGAHLHWTVRVNNARIDPLSLLAMLGK